MTASLSLSTVIFTITTHMNVHTTPTVLGQNPSGWASAELTHSNCGQSYKASTIVNYGSRVVIWGIFKSGTTLES